MSEDNPNINSLYHCINCGIHIPDELIKEINGFGGTVVCERCGIQQFIKIISADKSSTVIDAITDYNESHQAKKIEHSDETNKFSTYHLDRERFGYYLTIFACRYIYDDIKNSYLCLEPTDQYIEMIANLFIKESCYKKIEKKWLNEFKQFKKSLKKNYKELRSKIKSDPAERQKYLGVFRFLTKIVFELINKKDYDELQGIEYDIAEDLVKRDLFVADHKFKLPFRYNFRLGLSRIVYLKIKDIARKSNLRFCQLKLTNLEKRDIADEFVNYIIGHDQIIWDFLGELEQIQPRAFNEVYEQFCLELKSDNLFVESFNYYLRTLVGRIRDICCGRYKWKELCEFDRLIKVKLQQLFNVEVDFEQKSENLVATREIKVKRCLSNNEILEKTDISQNLNEGGNDKYTADELIEDLMVEIQKYSEELAILFPKRLFKKNRNGIDAKCSRPMLSRLWGYSDSYVYDRFSDYKENKNYRINDKALLRLRQRIYDRLGSKATKCYEIIDKYKNSEIVLREFDISLRTELGRISGEIILTQEEASQILGFIVKSRLSATRYDNYKFSLWRLNDMIERIELVFGEKAENCYKLIQKYKDLNKNLKEYVKQQHNVGKPHYFKDILPGELNKAYIFGFLGHDGFTTTEGRVGLRINSKDKVIIDKLIHLIELDKSKVKIAPETIFQIYKGERKEFKSLRIMFGCKPMAKELDELGDIGSGSAEKKVPPVIKNLIKVAKQKSLDDWIYTIEGQTVLAWLLGAYDADGSYHKFYSGVIISSHRSYLEEIKELFEINTIVCEMKEPGLIVEIFDREYITKGAYTLTFSSKNVMISMMESYWYSLQRKRPDDYKLSSSELDNYLGSFK